MTEDPIPSYIPLFRQRFVHNTSIYAVSCIHEPFTPHPAVEEVDGKVHDDLIELHLRGGTRLFVYPTAKDGTVKFCCWDLHYVTPGDVDLKAGLERCRQLGLTTVLETNDCLTRLPRVWHFMKTPADRNTMRNYRDVFGNFSVVFHPTAFEKDGMELPIRLPLAYTKSVLGYTAFVDEVGNGIDPIRALS